MRFKYKFPLGFSIPSALRIIWSIFLLVQASPPVNPARSAANKPLPPGWKCDKDQELHAHLLECSQYYRCVACSDPQNQGKWCYDEFVTCATGQSFDEKKKECVMGRCPQHPDILPPEWKCKYVGEKNSVPGVEECNKYYTCLACPDDSPWCYTNGECGSGQKYSEKVKQCVVTSRCPQWPPLLPEGYNCSKHGDLHVVPKECSNYYKCNWFKGEWTYKELKCPGEQTFDDTKKECVPGHCPQCPNELPKGWKCSEDDPIHVHPDDCTQYYNCTFVEECSHSGSYWGYELKQCAAGENFDDQADTCTKGKCPQNLPKLPPGWKCKKHGELKVVPNDCSKYYKCIYHQNKTWSYDLLQCPPGKLFDNTQQYCATTKRCPNLPPKLPGWTCTAEGQLNVNPFNCAEYYKCINCPDGGWCYELFRCPSEHNFNNLRKMCVKGPCCHCSENQASSIAVPPPKQPVSSLKRYPFRSKPVTKKPYVNRAQTSLSRADGKTCSRGVGKYVDYNCCSCYYRCKPKYKVVGKLTSFHHRCRTGYFNRQSKSCVPGSCPYKGTKPISYNRKIIG